MGKPATVLHHNVLYKYLSRKLSWNAMYNSGCPISKKDIAVLEKGQKGAIKNDQQTGTLFPYEKKLRVWESFS